MPIVYQRPSKVRARSSRDKGIKLKHDYSPVVEEPVVEEEVVETPEPPVVEDEPVEEEVEVTEDEETVDDETEPEEESTHYHCSQCDANHRKTSKTGKKHLKYEE